MRLIGCFIIALAMVILLAACSGNGFSGGNSAGSGGGGSGTASGVEMALLLTNATTGASTTEISANAPGRATAMLKDARTGSPIASAVVTFSTTLASINPSAGTAITDSNGQASVELLAGDTTGVDQVTASVVVNSETYTATLGFTITPPNLRLGNGTGVAFTEGQVAIGTTPLSAGGTTSATVTLVDDSGAPFLTPVEVNFSSNCTERGAATLDTPVTTVNGTASSTYHAKGCVGPDEITATVNIGGSTLTAKGTVEVLSPSLGAIEFVSATPTTIALKGTGGTGLSETSTVVFRVVDKFGNPVPNKTVEFKLNTTVGGLDLAPKAAQTNSEGKVETIVQSGTVATSVRVTATIAGTTPPISTQSDQLVVTTGIADQNSMSLSAETLNPEAFDYDGVSVPVTIHLADHFNNPVPDGTAVVFTTEGGSIEGSCTTTKGACTVNWVS